MEGSMQPQVFQWVAAPAPRAARIDSEIWEGLREDLTRVYRDKTLDETMNWMEVHHEFKASRRQYVAQFRIWGLKKYSTRAGSAPLMLRSVPSSIPQPVASDAPHASQHPCHDTSDDSGNATIPTEDDCSSGSTEHTTRLSLHNQSPGIPVQIWTSDTTMAERSDDTDASTLSAKSFQQSTPSEAEPPRPFTAFVVFGSTASPMESTEDSQTYSTQATQDPGRIENHELSGHTSSPLALTEGFQQYPSREVHGLKSAADFLFAARCYEDSFSLYHSMLDQRLASGRPEHTTATALLGCVRSAMTTASLESSSTTIVGWNKQWAGIWQDPKSKVLFDALLTNAYKRLRYGMDTDRGFANNTMFPAAQRRFLHSFPIYHRVLHLVTFSPSRRIMGVPHGSASVSFQASVGTDDISTVCTDDMATRLAHSLLPFPGIFPLTYATMVRMSLKWCSDNIKKVDFTCSPTRAPFYSEIDAQLCRGEKLYFDAIDLFCIYWTTWYRSYSSLQATSEYAAWFEAIEAANDISFAELLAITAYMVLDASEMTTPYNRRHLYYPTSICHQFRSGLEILSYKNDQQMMQAFLKAYQTWDMQRDDIRTSRASSTLGLACANVRYYARSCLSENILNYLDAFENPEVDEPIREARLSQPSSILSTTTRPSSLLSNPEIDESIRGARPSPPPSILSTTPPSSLLSNPEIDESIRGARPSPPPSILSTTRPSSLLSSTASSLRSMLSLQRRIPQLLRNAIQYDNSERPSTSMSGISGSSSSMRRVLGFSWTSSEATLSIAESVEEMDLD